MWELEMRRIPEGLLVFRLKVDGGGVIIPEGVEFECELFVRQTEGQEFPSVFSKFYTFD
jgi:hypothetical protein